MDIGQSGAALPRCWSLARRQQLDFQGRYRVSLAEKQCIGGDGETPGLSSRFLRRGDSVSKTDSH